MASPILPFGRSPVLQNLVKPALAGGEAMGDPNDDEQWRFAIKYSEVDYFRVKQSRLCARVGVQTPCNPCWMTLLSSHEARSG